MKKQTIYTISLASFCFINTTVVFSAKNNSTIVETKKVKALCSILKPHDRQLPARDDWFFDLLISDYSHAEIPTAFIKKNYKHVNLFKLFTKYNIPLDSVELKDGLSPLMYAIKKKKIHSIEHLLSVTKTFCFYDKDHYSCLTHMILTYGESLRKKGLINVYFLKLIKKLHATQNLKELVDNHNILHTQYFIEYPGGGLCIKKEDPKFPRAGSMAVLDDNDEIVYM